MRIRERMNSYFEVCQPEYYFQKERWRHLSGTAQAVGESQRFINTTNSGKYAFLDQNTEREGKRKLLR